MPDTEMIIVQPTEALMTYAEAEQCLTQIRGHIDEARRLLYELDVRKGWQALGYRSLYQCIIDPAQELYARKSQLYRQAAAAKVEALIAGDGSIGMLPERVLRPLTAQRFANNPIIVTTLFTVAQAIAGDQPLTSVHTEAVVEALTDAIGLGVFTDGEGDQSPVFERLADAAMAIVQRRLQDNREYVRESLARRNGSNLMHIVRDEVLMLTILTPDNAIYSSENSVSVQLTLHRNVWGNQMPPASIRIKVLAEDE